ncbi:MAG: right-handed parallel beta-helix repeat-containing protein [Anaerolineae bacterium]|nr:right-handed parallel beta-helix repeat-containing protein [Anaerolineae bacterium]
MSIHSRSLRTSWLVVALVVLVSAVFVLVVIPSAHAATPIYVRPGGDDALCNGTVDVDYSGGVAPNCAVQTIGQGVTLVDPGGTVFVRAGTYVVSSLVTINKAGVTLDGDGAGATIVQVSGTGDRFNIAASGVTLQDFEIEKTDTAGGQDIIRISNGNNVSIKNNTIHGQYVYPAGDVSRAFVVNAGSFSGLNIEGNTIYSLRQPAYISGTHTGTVQNNYTYSTKGWVLEGGDLTFTGNTWGTGAQANVYDIAILNTVPGSYYTDIVAMSNANNGAVIEDQRPVPAVLSVVYVDAAAPVCATDCGGLNPYHTITPAIPRVVAGGTINVAAGTYAETVSIDKALTLQGAGKASTVIQPASLLSTGVGHKYTANMQVTMFVNGASGVTVSDMTIDGNDLAGGNAVVFWNGSSGTLENVKIMRPRPFDGVQTGQGLAVDATTPASVNLAVINSDFEQWNKNAIDVVNGNGGAVNGGDITVNVNGGTFTGRGPTATTAQNAILFWERAGGTINGTVQNAVISDIEYTPAGTEGAGILQYGSPNGTVVATGNTFTNVEQYIGVAGGSSNNLDATGNTFDGVDPGSATLSQIFAIMDKIWDGLDDPGNGAVIIVPGYLYVTAQSGSIQNAIDLANPGDTIVVQAGAYAESLTIDQSLALQCAQAGVPVASRTAGSANETIIDASGLPTAITIKANDVSVDGCDITGDAATYAGVLVYATTGTGNRSNVDVLNNFVHGMALPNPSSSAYVSSYGIFGLGDDVSGTRLTITDLDITGNEIYDLGGAVSGPDTSAGAGVWLYSIQGASAGDGATVSGNDFHDIADGFNSPVPEPGSAVVIVDDGDGNPDDGALVTGNTYANTYGGDILYIGTSTLDEMGSDYSGVTLLALNVGNTATFVEANLAPYARTDKPTGWPSSTAYFAHVKDAIDNSDTGATVNVTAGTFNEGPQVVVDKDIDLVGSGAGVTVLKPTADTGNSGDPRGWFLVDTTGSLDLSGLTMDGTGRKVYQAIRYKGTAGSVSDVEFAEIRYNDSGPDYSGVALAAFGTGKVDVSNSSFSGIGRVGVLYYGSGVNGSTYSGNTYTGKGVGDWLDYALDISAGAVVTVDDNQVSDNLGVASVDSSTSAGYLVTTYFGAGTAADFTNNAIENNTAGIEVGYDGSDTSTVTASNNCFSSNGFGVESTGPLVNAKNNYWGSPTGPYNATSNPGGSGDEVSDDVDFIPWLDSCGGSPSGNFYNQTDDTYFATMQDAVDAASYGDVIVPLTAGPFGVEGSATVSISGVTIKLSGRTFGPGSPAFTITANDVTILGPGVLDGGGSAFPGILVQPGAGNFTLRGAEVTDWADGIQVAGAVVSLKLTNNWIHDNTDHGLQVDDTPTGVITINGNLFKANGNEGVVYSGSGSLNAIYNSWGDLAGPTGTDGDGVGAGVTYIPWTFSEVYMDVDPPAEALTRSVPETTSFDVALKIDAAKLYGLTFQITYDPLMLTLNTTTFSAPWAGGPCAPLSASLGVIKYRCNLSLPATEYDATGGTVATFNFSVNPMPAPPDNGPWYTYFDISADPANTSTGALGGIKVFVNNAGYGAPSDPDRDITDPDDGEIVIVGLANFTGFVDLEGNDNDSGATLLVKNQQTKAGSVDLASGTSAPSGAYTTSYLPSQYLLVGTTYWLQFDAPLHLPTTTLVGSVTYPTVPTDWTNSALAATRPLTPLTFAFLLGGDATNNDVVDVLDAGCIGTYYQIAFTDCGGLPGSSPDVKVNGVVDIFDLVLMGSNYELTYSPWSQP